MKNINEIVKKSKDAQLLWAKSSLDQRAKVLERLKETIISQMDIIVKDMVQWSGKTEFEVYSCEILPVISNLNFFTQEKTYQVLKKEKISLQSNPLACSYQEFIPLGVVAIISPWNYPFMLSLKDISVALMAGNSVILKPSEYSSSLIPLLENLFTKSKIPQDLIQVISGDGRVGSDLVNADIHKVCFTGSLSTGKKVAHSLAGRFIPMNLELGGKDAAIILEPFNMQETIEGIAWAAFANCGQTCEAIEMVFVPKNHYDEFVKKMGLFLESIPDNNFGVMNNKEQKIKVVDQLNDAIVKGARVAYEKKLKVLSNKKELQLNPMIIVDVSLESKLLKEETFGPLLPIISYEPEALNEVYDWINNSAFGLTTSFWCSDREKLRSHWNSVHSGVICANDHMVTPGFPQAPWSGHKQSGFGFSSSADSLREFSKRRYFYDGLNIIKNKFWTYPYSNSRLYTLIKFIKNSSISSPIHRNVDMLRILPRIMRKYKIKKEKLAQKSI